MAAPSNNTEWKRHIWKHTNNNKKNELNQIHPTSTKTNIKLKWQHIVVNIWMFEKMLLCNFLSSGRMRDAFSVCGDGANNSFHLSKYY